MRKRKHIFNYRETICTIISENERAIKAAISSIKHHRELLEAYIKKNPKFLYSLKPVPIQEAPRVVKLMAEAAEKANVGPMAAVAGVLADLAVEEMILNGAKIAVVENGGEVSAFSKKEPIDVAFLAGNSPLSRRLCFRLEKFPIGVATSSGLYSHALSFGEAEAVTIFAINAGVADAAATAIGNIVKGKPHQKVVEKSAEKALSIEGVRGAFILYRGLVGVAGEVPKLVKIAEN